jgi:hypothetical protein
MLIGYEEVAGAAGLRAVAEGAVHPDLSPVRAGQASADPQEGALARAVRADHRGDLAGPYGQVHAGQHTLPAEAFGDSARIQPDGSWRLPVRSRFGRADAVRDRRRIRRWRPEYPQWRFAAVPQVGGRLGDHVPGQIPVDPVPA